MNRPQSSLNTGRRTKYHSVLERKATPNRSKNLQLVLLSPELIGTTYYISILTRPARPSRSITVVIGVFQLAQTGNLNSALRQNCRFENLPKASIVEFAPSKFFTTKNIVETCRITVSIYKWRFPMKFFNFFFFSILSLEIY